MDRTLLFLHRLAVMTSVSHAPGSSVIVQMSACSEPVQESGVFICDTMEMVRVMIDIDCNALACFKGMARTVKNSQTKAIKAVEAKSL